MKDYQEKYIANLRRIFQLNAPPEAIPQDAAAYVSERDSNVEEIRRLSVENTQMLRRELFPVIDNIVSATEEDIRSLEEFAAGLQEGAAYLDLALCSCLHSALITFARRWGKRDMLIRELYSGAMAFFYMQDILNISGQPRYRLKMSMYFGEAASYIKQYDSIEDMQTRGYIHRAMGNLALAYPDPTPEDGMRKMAAIRRSLRILTDPVYHEKSPSLPWELYITKSHQERTTGLGLFRAGIEDPEALREVMESAEFVLDQQLESSRKRGGQPALRWIYAYEAAQYHCGVKTLGELLGWMEQVYMERDEGDYSPGSVYRNMFIPALYAFYIDTSPEYRASKRAVMELMYRRMVEYIRRMPDNQLSESTLKNLLACLQTFVEYPGGITEKEFIIRLVVCRSPDTFVSSRMAAQVAELMAEHAISRRPELLVGSLGCGDAGQVRAARESFLRFVYEGCLLHNVGALPLNHLVRRIGRSWMEEEKDMYQCHVFAGQKILEQSDSTRPYAYVALGHHRFYDGRGGYPAGYRREDDPEAVLTDLIGAAVHLVRLMDKRAFLSSRPRSLPEALEQAEREAGSRLSPDWVNVLLEIREELEEYFRRGQEEAYNEVFLMLRA